MGLFTNIKSAIDDKSSMSVNSISVLVSALITFIMAFALCFVIIYDVTYDGKIDSDVGELSWLLIAGSSCLLGSGIPKAYIDSRMKTRSWVEGEKLQIEAEEDLEDLRVARRKRRKEENNNNNEETVE